MQQAEKWKGRVGEGEREGERMEGENGVKAWREKSTQKQDCKLLDA